MIDNYDPFTDQESFPEPMDYLVEEYDRSGSYELDAGAIFKTVSGKYRGVVVSGCS